MHTFIYFRVCVVAATAVGFGLVALRPEKNGRIQGSKGYSQVKILTFCYFSSGRSLLARLFVLYARTWWLERQGRMRETAQPRGVSRWALIRGYVRSRSERSTLVNSRDLSGDPISRSPTQFTDLFVRILPSSPPPTLPLFSLAPRHNMSEVAGATTPVEEAKVDVKDVSSAPTEEKQTESGPANVTVPPTVHVAEGAAKPAENGETGESDSEARQRAIRQGAFSVSVSCTLSLSPFNSRVLLRRLEPPIRQVRPTSWISLLVLIVHQIHVDPAHR